MEIHINRGQEFKKGGLLSGKNVRLSLEVTVTLTEQERRLVGKYYEPDISDLAFHVGGRFVREFGATPQASAEAFTVVKVDGVEGKLSKFHVTAHVDDGHARLGHMHAFEKAVVGALVENLAHLEALEQWQGERVLTSEGE